MSHAVTSATDQGNDPIVVIGAGFVGVSTALWLQREGRNVVLIDKAVEDVRRIATALKPIIRRDNGFTWTEIEGENLDSYDTVFAAEYSFLAALDGHGQITDPGSYLASLVDHFTSSGGTLMREHVIGVTRFMQRHRRRDNNL